MKSIMNTIAPISNRLKLLLTHAKSKHNINNWKEIAVSLADEYCTNMTIGDVLFHVTKAYEELIAEPRFETRHDLIELLKSPIYRFSLFPNLEDKHTNEEIYESLINYMMTRLMLARSDWLFN